MIVGNPCSGKLQDSRRLVENEAGAGLRVVFANCVGSQRRLESRLNGGGFSVASTVKAAALRGSG